MRRKQTYLPLCIAATVTLMGLISCNNEETDSLAGGPVEAQISAGLSAPATRAVDDKWNADNIGVMVTDASASSMEALYRNVKYSTVSTGTTADFTAVGEGIFFHDADETVTFAAYAPYQTSANNATLPGTDGVIKVDTKENNTEAKQESIDFLFASGAKASKESPTVTFTENSGSDGTDCSFHHKMTRLQLVLQTSTVDGFSADDIFDATAVKLGGLKHSGTFNVTTGAVTTDETETVVSDWDIIGCKKADDTSTRTYTLILLPQDVSSALNFSVMIDGQAYYNNTDITPKLKAGYSYTYTITVKRSGLAVSGCTIAEWGNGTSGSGDAKM